MGLSDTVASREIFKGQLAESWEFPEPGLTSFIYAKEFTGKICAGNGREFTADDVVFHYHRIYAMGGAILNPALSRRNRFRNLISVTAADKFTVVFKLRITNQEAIMETCTAWTGTCLKSEAVKSGRRQ